MRQLLIAAGVLGASLDVLLHVLQLYHLPYLKTLQEHTAWITLTSVTLLLLSLVAQFNAGALLLNVFIGCLAVLSIIKGKDLAH